MKKLSIIILFLKFSPALYAQSAWTDKNRLMPDKLRNLPVGIIVTHDPNPCFPVKEGDTYYWKHSTYVKSIVGQLTVMECGSFIWYNANGWYSNMNYTPVEFSEAFKCRNAILMPNKTYTYARNWRFGKQLYGGDALWYVIAKDRNGKIYKGVGLIETEDKTIENK